jgi:hypothetical protein
MKSKVTNLVKVYNQVHFILFLIGMVMLIYVLHSSYFWSVSVSSAITAIMIMQSFASVILSAVLVSLDVPKRYIERVRSRDVYNFGLLMIVGFTVLLFPVMYGFIAGVILIELIMLIGRLVILK